MLVSENAGQLVVMENDLLAVAGTLSVTCRVDVAVPALDGVPLIRPDALIARPVGKEPAVLAHV